MVRVHHSTVHIMRFMAVIVTRRHRKARGEAKVRDLVEQNISTLSFQYVQYNLTHLQDRACTNSVLQ